KNAELKIRLNKSDFSAGEEIEVSIIAPYTGAGLITIERDKVYAHRWFKTTKTSAVRTIKVPAGLEGNGYVNVSFVRAIDSKEIFMSPLSYGVAPFTVSRDRRDIKVKVDVPELVRPGEPMEIKYKARRAGKVAIIAVDEGILQVAGYSTPDPLAHFVKKRALEVSTSQILDLLLPEIKLLRELSASGGGMYDSKRMKADNLNPFKRKRVSPAVYWSGIIDIGTKERTLTYNVPDHFSGALRVMAVAVSASAIGASAEKTLVRGHFVLSPNVPTFVAPGDEFEVSVGVANNVEGSGTEPTVNLQLATTKHVKILGDPKRALTIGEGKEDSAVFKVKALTKLGNADFKFTAEVAGKKSSYSVGMSVRPSVPYMTTLAGGSFKKGARELPVKRTMYPEFRTLEASGSMVPLSIAKGLTSYLRKFPHGCTEQLVSQAFPAIILRARPEFGYSPDKVEQSLKDVIHILRSRQNSAGAFGYWTASSNVSDYLTTYALHFLTVAKEAGYPVPQDLLSSGLNYLKKRPARSINSIVEAREDAYALYILTRNGFVLSTYMNDLLDELKSLYKGEESKWQNDLTGIFIAATFKMLKQNGEAVRIIKKIKMDKKYERAGCSIYSSLLHDSTYLYILARHFPERLKKLPADDILYITDKVAAGKHNTLSSAFSILALDAYAGVVGTPAGADFKMSEFDSTGKEIPFTPPSPSALFHTVKIWEKATKVRYTGNSPYNIFYQST
ncbi:MAG: alpha-2-macroglobulin family protein, partial [Thermodesulfobacteriota bacterium]